MKTEAELIAALEEKMADYEPPSDEQLARYICMTVYKSPEIGSALTLNLIKTNSNLRSLWLKAHRTMQEDAYIVAMAIDDAAEDVISTLNGGSNG